jgi:hypothetical protein
VKPGHNPDIPLLGDILYKNFCDPSTVWLGSNALWCTTVSDMVREIVASTLIC